jgi:hypothetical protein
VNRDHTLGGIFELEARHRIAVGLITLLDRVLGSNPRAGQNALDLRCEAQSYLVGLDAEIKQFYVDEWDGLTYWLDASGMDWQTG